jgi:hypothetical protein
MQWVHITMVALALLGLSCGRGQGTATEAGQKIEFSVSDLDDEGLRGPPDGKVAVAYEFCIPDNEDCRARVREIDSTVQFMPGSKGRIGAGPGQCLCIGSTHQKDYRQVLRDLAKLPFVERIIECHFE